MLILMAKLLYCRILVLLYAHIVDVDFSGEVTLL